MNTQSVWNFELGTEEGTNNPIWILVGFQQMDGQNSRNLKNHTIYIPPVTGTHVVIDKRRYLDNSLFLNYDDAEYSQGYVRKRGFQGFNTRWYPSSV